MIKAPLTKGRTMERVHVYEGSKENIRRYESGWAIDIHGETKFIQTSHVVSWSETPSSYRLSLSRKVFRRLISRTKVLSRPDASS